MSCTPKFSKLYHGVETFKRNNFPFGKKFKFPTDIELKIQEANLIWIWFEFERDPNLWGKIP
jgi:hypothetical protein